MDNKENEALAPRENIPTENEASFICAKCGKGFFTKPALAMHVMRVHTRAGQKGAKWKQHQSEEDRLRRKREYNAKMRKRFYAQGLDSRGRVPKPGYKPRHRETKTWSPERRAKYEKTIRKQRKKLRLEIRNNFTRVRGHVDYCPYCGGHIAPIEIALGTMERISEQQTG